MLPAGAPQWSRAHPPCLARSWRLRTNASVSGWYRSPRPLAAKPMSRSIASRSRSRAFVVVGRNVLRRLASGQLLRRKAPCGASQQRDASLHKKFSQVKLRHARIRTIGNYLVSQRPMTKRWGLTGLESKRRTILGMLSVATPLANLPPHSYRRDGPTEAVHDIESPYSFGGLSGRPAPTW